MLLEVTCTLTTSDLLACYYYALRKAGKPPPIFYVIAGCILFAIGFRVFLESITLGREIEIVFVSGLTMVLGGSMTWSQSRFGLVRAINIQAKHNPSVFTENHVKIDEAWLSSSSAYDRTQIRWQIVSAVDSNTRYIYITAGNKAYILAKTCFGSPEEAQRFLSLATQYWQQAKAQPAVTSSPEGVWPPAPRALD